MQARISKFVIVGALGSGLMALACGGNKAPTQRLLDARQAYEEARNAPGAELRPDELLEARQALQRAEAVHQEEPGSAIEAHHAYLAERRANLASARAAEAQARQELQQAEQSHQQRQAELRKQSEENLADAREALQQTRDALSQVRRALAATGGENRELLEKQRELEEQQASLEQKFQQEHQARMHAEETAQAALASLERVAQVKAEAHETVITLSGSVLFPTAEATLLPIAEQRLATVAEALKQQDDSVQFVVEGHTDSRGAKDMNQRLSLARAESVREFLVRQGVDGNRIRAVGRGQSEPVASNDSPEGRANNRRVEIIVQGGQQQQQGQGDALQDRGGRQTP
jgi:outer membrane protein OmpA-like peptidoglycan-associated protein